MKQHGLVDTLWDQIVVSSNSRRTILICGAWGVGKSHAWTCFVERAKREDQRTKIITISLFGHSTLAEIRNQLKADLILTKTRLGYSPLPSLINKAIGNTSLSSALGQASQKWLGVNIDPLSFVPMQFGSDYVVCFDDLERKSPSIAMRDVLGLIEEVRQSSRVVVIADESKLSGEDQREFYTFKEKIVDRTYRLDSQDRESLIEIFNRVFPEFSHTDVVIDMFIAFGDQNLRTLDKIADFLKDLSRHVAPDEQLTRLCGAVIFESLKVQTELNCDLFSQEPIMGTDDIFNRYFISNRLRVIGRQVCSYYTTNTISVDSINRVLNPPPATRDDELLAVFQDSFHRNALSLQEAIDEFINQIDSLNTHYFRNIERLIVLYFHAKYLNSNFNLGFDPLSMESSAIKIIQLMVDMTPPEQLTSVSMLDMYFLQAPDIAKNLVTEADRMISEKLNSYAITFFQECFELEDYHSCSRLLENHPSIFLDILYIFDRLADDTCTRSYVFFIQQIRDHFRNQYSDHIKDRLTALSANTSDVVIRNRINTIFKEL